MGEDGPRGRSEDGPRLRPSPESRRTRKGPPVGRVYGRRRGRRLVGKKASLLGNSLDEVRIALPEGSALLDPKTLFGPLPVWLEIGFGGGEHLAAQALMHPGRGFIGCEPFLNGVSRLLALLEEGGQRNVRVLADDARLLLSRLPRASLAGAFLLFPDPWPKRRHEERRFLAQGIDLLAEALADAAEFRIATDHAALAAWMEQMMNAHSAFQSAGRSVSRPAEWPPTRYEAKAIAAGRNCVYLTYRRRARALATA